MIRNLVLDMGNVLIRFDPDGIMNRLGVTDPQDRLLLKHEVFSTVEWAATDRGSLTEETAYPRMASRLPERLHSVLRDILFHWNEPMVPVEGMEEYARECKKLGLKVFVLSNVSARGHEYMPHLPAADIMDGMVLSGDLLLVKPQPEIYLYFTSRFGLRPEECLFVDDNCVNVEGCVQCGWNGIVFHGDMAELRRKTREMGIPVQA